MMRSTQILTMLVAGLLTLSMAGCGDVDFGQPSHPDIEMAEQAVTVVPEFQINGTSELPEQLYLSELGLVISEIKLEPITTDSGSVAYSTREPTVLKFDVARGETVRQGEPVKLPEAGRYLVGVRLEPAQVSETVDPSLSVAGFVASNGIDRVDPRFDGKTSDGSPIPLPYDEDEADEDDEDDLKDAPALPTQWTPFHVGSQKTKFFSVGDVFIQPGRQKLTFQFNVNDWALDLVDPVLSAVENNSSAEMDQEGVDATRSVEGTGRGAEKLFETASVRATAGR
jgi:hypothetical protein